MKKSAQHRLDAAIIAAIAAAPEPMSMKAIIRAAVEAGSGRALSERAIADRVYSLNRSKTIQMIGIGQSARYRLPQAEPEQAQAQAAEPAAQEQSAPTTPVECQLIDVGGFYVAVPVDEFPDHQRVVVVPTLGRPLPTLPPVQLGGTLVPTNGKASNGSPIDQHHGPSTDLGRQLARDIGAVVSRGVQSAIDDLLHQHGQTLATVQRKNLDLGLLNDRLAADLDAKDAEIDQLKTKIATLEKKLDRKRQLAAALASDD